ncbi:flagellar protein export ATPase FliI [Halanaerobium praevalens]|uniref:Type 3 secretion system ATPase n=1 Tax=Halanaerobium praevalens (strain ATCC 33744 / DSM 2228 / GSL) TaxID=572479 RepID=E3DPM5_HALPG|nr:flagellar protein export ATPase FliI [Halanaerobium praevalens]ADO76700.1 type III secretion system ATPase, FliI/YscN [Halanaerobium praevalens DSM 2228]
MINLDLSKLETKLNNINMTRNFGHINRVIGLVIESIGPQASIGELCLIKGENGDIKAEVVGFDDNKVLMMPIGEMEGIRPGARVIATDEKLKVKVGKELLGKIIDGSGNIISGEDPSGLNEVPVNNKPPDPLTRARIKAPLSLGVRCIDGFLTCGKGQRMGIFAGSGVGKSTLLGMAARNTNADINVIGLVGERGREVRDFIEKDLGAEGLERSIVVVATSDQPALLRVKAANIATAIAEYFRDQGEDVLLMMDSVTRVAMALREVGLAIGEPPATRGYPPSVFAELPKLLERTGTNDVGSITALYTVLVEGDDFNEPVSDTVRGILDGHISLSRELAESSHYPAVDVLSSVSRIMEDIVSKEHSQAAAKLQKIIATYNQSEDLINIGAYEKGSNPEVDRAIAKIDEINNFLTQGINEEANYESTVQQLIQIAEK